MTYTGKDNCRKVTKASTIQSTTKKVVRKTQKKKEVEPGAEKPKVCYLKLKEFYSLNKLRDTRKVPELRLCGKWLEQAGFTAPEYVSVTVMKGLLIVRNLQNIIREEMN